MWESCLVTVFKKPKVVSALALREPPVAAVFCTSKIVK